MQPWTQVYDPFGNIWLSSLVAVIPIIFFFVALAVFRMKGALAGTITVLLALAVAVFFYQMPVASALMSGIQGFLFGLWPIAWIIIAAVFLYKVTVKTGQFDIIRASVISITEDQRLQMLMIGFSFGAFLEGAAGFGAPVAITAALLVGLGFNPLYAAGLCLIANTAPVAFGAVGIPIIVAGQVSGVDTFKIGAMAGRQLPFLAVFVPFWLIFIMDGWKGVKETWPAVLVAGGSFALCVFLTSNYIGPELPDIISALVSLIAITVFLKYWKPKRIFRFKDTTEAERHAHDYSLGQILRAWSPFLILTLMVTLWSLKPFKALFAKGAELAFTNLTWEVPFLHNLIAKVPPIVPTIKEVPAVYTLNLISATGTAILIAAIIAIVALSMRPTDGLKTLGETFRELKLPIYTIGTVLAFAYVANASGLSTTLALLLAGAGDSFPFFSPVLGWLGVFLTGSDTSSNALFGALQATTAHQIGVSDVLLVAANTTGGVTGKMISPQSIAVACAAVGLIGHEANLFRFTLKHSLFFLLIICVMTTLQAYVFPWMIP
ncbi:lactate permease LctP family transporter [Rhodospirillum rubrum]|uniref:L-lactate permease n=1 Tax=Rhodospirillum rubrum (strain ATCC 11170 / ATH 1.1.1 / DSM 467 / LMG 4362 / NCIMB 8255 / S1) TaxID=269796 RepID=Q2RUI5_RHORT|nr:lactate permease LctP family transporter [Rhodospirillum rubrum]ABC22210.1 L-lactate permease [Rhodospirillum rubrum ATCC 11170]AEO47926.1 L-lactate permease [Rhodospirillum rubrum F11]MBK5953799.1 L-lactate permease [Rhodospirillum rubrum]QXG81854.1 lactate permease LctP family transporter [Rhodospirillum rubrum]HAQ00488.1 L-lactate permease [Rhodospirillum rubrum]